MTDCMSAIFQFRGALVQLRNTICIILSVKRLTLQVLLLHMHAILHICFIAENVQDVCTILNRTSHYYERTLPGSTCMYTVNGSNACRNCLDLNCSIVVSTKFNVILIAKISLLPCYNGNLNVPIHAIESRILDENGQKQFFTRLSTTSFDASFKLTVFGFVELMPFISANIDNRGDGVFFQVSKSWMNTLRLRFCQQTNH